MRIFLSCRGEPPRFATANRLCNALARAGHDPYVPYLFWPQFLNSSVNEERARGVEIGQAFLAVCDEVWVWTQEGITNGMHADMEQARTLDKPIHEIIEIVEQPNARPLIRLIALGTIKGG